MLRAIFVLLVLLVHPALAQDRAGNDTAGDWVIDHYKPFGLWDSICDHRMTGDTKEERCYLRYVEVFSPRPKFAAQFIFVTPGPEIEIGLERGTRFPRGGIRIEGAGGETWRTDNLLCRTGFACNFDGDEARILLSAMEDGTVFAFNFTDRHGQPQELRWDLTRFAEAVADFKAEASKRGL